MRTVALRDVDPTHGWRAVRSRKNEPARDKRHWAQARISSRHSSEVDAHQLRARAVAPGVVLYDVHCWGLGRTCSAEKHPEHRDDRDWIDADRALTIAYNVEIGTDLSVVLDPRYEPLDPRVVGFAYGAEHMPHLGCRHGLWLEVAPSLTAFAKAIGCAPR